MRRRTRHRGGCDPRGLGDHCVDWRAGRTVIAGFALGLVCYLVLIACYTWRFASYRPEFMADATGPRTAFSLFTFTAAPDVLGSRLAGGGYYTAMAVLLVVAGTAWLLLSYGVPLVLITGHGTGSALAGINGNCSCGRSEPSRWPWTSPR